MTDLEVALSNLDRDAKAAKVQLDLGSALANLRNNRDFKKLITEGYLKDEAIRLVSLKADPMMQTPEFQASIVKQIDAIGFLAQYFITIDQKHGIAVNQVKSIDAMREDLLEHGV